MEFLLCKTVSSFLPQLLQRNMGALRLAVCWLTPTLLTLFPDARGSEACLSEQFTSNHMDV